MAGNKHLGKAKQKKIDEFYTQLVDIENELRHYKEYLKGKRFFVIVMTHTKAIFSNSLP